MFPRYYMHKDACFNHTLMCDPLQKVGLFKISSQWQRRAHLNDNKNWKWIFLTYLFFMTYLILQVPRKYFLRFSGNSAAKDLLRVHLNVNKNWGWILFHHPFFLLSSGPFLFSVVGAARKSCLSSDYVITGATEGYLASIVTEESGCGNADTPWLVSAEPGQRLNITLHDFALSTVVANVTSRHASSTRHHCHVYAIIKVRRESNSCDMWRNYL